MIRIGALARKAGISKRTLHYYEQIELLKPTVISENGYRHYDEQAVFRLQQILLLKSIGYTLQQIKTLLHDQKNADEHEDWLLSLREQIVLLERQKEELSRKQYYLRSAVDILHVRGMGGMNDLLEVIEKLNGRPMVENVVPALFGEELATTERKRQILANLPVWGSGDERLERLVSLLRRTAELMPHSSPDSPEAQLLAGQLDDIAAELFEGDAELLDTYWERIKPEKGAEPATIGFESELMVYVERMIDVYRKRKEGEPDEQENDEKP